ncbi:DUF4249 family protein [Bacteroidota bacterium]
MKNTYYIFIFVLIILLSSCYEKIEVDLQENDEYTLIVEGGITDEIGKAHQISLKTSKPYYDTSSAPVLTGADVSITDGQNNYLLTENEPGIYKTDPDEFTGIVGNTYIFNITLPNGDKYKATESLEPVANIDSANWVYEYLEFIDMYFYKILYYGPEPKGYGDYYIWNLYINNELYNDTLRESQIQDDLLVDGNYIFDFEIYWLTEEEIKKDTSEVKVEIRSTSENYYDFHYQTLYQSVYRGGMFDPPPANIRTTNVIPVGHDRYAYGYFTASSVDSYTFTLIKSQQRQRKPFDFTKLKY